MNHQANLLDIIALPVHRCLCGIVGGVVAGAEGVVVADWLSTVTRLQNGEPPVGVATLIVIIPDPRKIFKLTNSISRVYTENNLNRINRTPSLSWKTRPVPRKAAESRFLCVFLGKTE